MANQLHLPAVGDRVRVALLHGGQWRPILWLRVGKDGSVYAGVLVGTPSTGLLISKSVDQGKATISYSAGVTLAEKTLPSSSRVSFKASGEIHLGNKVLPGRPLEGLLRPLQLCIVTFVHPSRYRLPTKKNDNDYDVGIVGYPLDEARPMYGAIFASPWPYDGTISRISVGNMKCQSDIFLAFRNLGRTPDLALQVAIGHGPEGSWPNLPGIAVLAQQ
jgi:hypothetical protein